MINKQHKLKRLLTLLILIIPFLLKGNEIDSAFLRLNTFELDNKASIKSYQDELIAEETSLSKDTLLILYERGILAAMRIQDDSLINKFAARIAYIYYIHSEYSKAKDYTELELKHGLAIGSIFYSTRAYFYLGNIEMLQENYVTAINYFLLAAEKGINSKEAESFKYISYVNLSNCFLQLGEMEQSIENLKLAEPYFAILPDSINLNLYYLSVVYSGLSQSYLALEELDSSNYYNERMLTITEQIENGKSILTYQDEVNIGNNYMDAIDYYFNTENYEKAKTLYEKKQQLDFPYPEKKHYADLTYLIISNQLDKAKLLIDEPPSQVDSTTTYNYYKLKYKYYEERGDAEKSFSYYQKYRDTELNTYKNQRIKLSQFAAARLKEVEQKNVISILEKEKKYQQKLVNFFYLLLFLMVLLFGLAIYAYFQIKEKNDYLNQSLEKNKLIQEQTQKLQKNEQQRNNLLTNIAHEFQTPLSIIQGLGQVIFNTARLTDTEQESLGIIVKNSQRLSLATKQILEINPSKLEDNNLNVVPFLLSEFIQFILPEHEFLAKEKDIKIQVSELSKLEVIIYSDVNKLAVIIRNLLSNAIKYSFKGGEIYLSYSNEANLHEISIKDNGRGISKEEENLIFNRYFQSENNNLEGGFGLGLAICKEYVKSLGGTISLKSTQNIGTTFTIKFPQKAQTKLEVSHKLHEFPKSPELEKFALKLDTKDLKHAPVDSLLIVEDNKDFCNYLETILKYDYHLSFVHDGEEAIKLLNNFSPKLIITDWMMAGMDGLTFVQHLKNTSEFYHLPILMLSARSMTADITKALRVGVDDYLIKPFKNEILKQRISKLISLKEDKYESNLSLSSTLQKELLPNIPIKDQNWLLLFQEIVTPLLGDFNLNLKQIASLMEISPKQLNIKISKITGLTPKKYIQELRYWEARRLLETRKLNSIKMVSYSIGFRDNKNFSRKFKERFGIYPSQYLV